MMKKLVMALVVVGAAMFAKADFLYWQIANRGEFSTATLWANNAGTKTEIETALAQGVDGQSVLTGTSTGLVQTDLAGLSGDGYSYFVELVTYSAADEKIGDAWLKEYSYNDLVSSGYISTGAVAVPSYAAGGGVNMNQGGYIIPEPTSGMLFLLGGALMALRRRRRA